MHRSRWRFEEPGLRRTRRRGLPPAQLQQSQQPGILRPQAPQLPGHLGRNHVAAITPAHSATVWAAGHSGLSSVRAHGPECQAAAGTQRAAIEGPLSVSWDSDVAPCGSSVTILQGQVKQKHSVTHLAAGQS